MPIKNLTDAKSSTRTFGRLGVIRKGIIHQDGKLEDLDYFRFVPKKGPYEDGLQEIWDSHYGEKPVKIEVFFLKPTVEENWSTWMESWGKTGLKFRCNGEHWVQWLDEKTLKPVRDYDLKKARVCPYCSGEKERTKADPGDKAVGYLEVMLLPFLNAGYTGSITVHTTSINDLGTISGQLYATYEVAAQYGGSLEGIPFDLMRVPETIQSRYQMEDGQYAKRPTEKYMLKITPSPHWVSLNMMQARQIAMKERVLIPLPAIEEEEGLAIPVEHIVGEVVEEEIKEPAPKVKAPPKKRRKSKAKSEPKPEPDSQSREQMKVPEVYGRIQDHLQRLRGSKFGFKDQGSREGALWKIRTHLEATFEDEEDRDIAYLFLTGEEDIDAELDDPQIEVLRKYLSVKKIGDKEWVLEDVVIQELQSIVEERKSMFEEEVDEAPEDRKTEPLFEDSSEMDYIEKREYCTKLFHVAKQRKIDIPSYTDEKMDEFIAIAEDLLK